MFSAVSGTTNKQLFLSDCKQKWLAVDWMLRLLWELLVGSQATWQTKARLKWGSTLGKCKLFSFQNCFPGRKKKVIACKGNQNGSVTTPFLNTIRWEPCVFNVFLKFVLFWLLSWSCASLKWPSEKVGEIAKTTQRHGDHFRCSGREKTDGIIEGEGERRKMNETRSGGGRSDLCTTGGSSQGGNEGMMNDPKTLSDGETGGWSKGNKLR